MKFGSPLGALHEWRAGQRRDRRAAEKVVTVETIHETPRSKAASFLRTHRRLSGRTPLGLLRVRPPLIGKLSEVGLCRVFNGLRPRDY